MSIIGILKEDENRCQCDYCVRLRRKKRIACDRMVKGFREEVRKILNETFNSQ